MKGIIKRAEIRHSENRRIIGNKKTNKHITHAIGASITKSVTMDARCDHKKPVARASSESATRAIRRTKPIVIQKSNRKELAIVAPLLNGQQEVSVIKPMPEARRTIDTSTIVKTNKQKSKGGNYAELAKLNPEQFKAFIYLIATAINFEDADSLIHKYYPKFEEKKKLAFLVEHFNIYGIFGKNLNDKIRYLFVVKSILRAARNMGADFVIKK